MTIDNVALINIVRYLNKFDGLSKIRVLLVVVDDARGDTASCYLDINSRPIDRRQLHSLQIAESPK